jgi:anti-sigma-K factor RskA
MRASRPEPHTLVGAYVLDALGPGDPARFERHLARCEQCANEIRGLAEVTARLACAAATEPPPGLTQRALAAAARTRQLPPITQDRPRPWAIRHASAGGPAGRAGDTRPGPASRSWLLPRLAPALAGAMVILLVVLGLAARGAQHQLRQDQLGSQAIAAVLTARDAHMISARVSTGGTATIVMSGREHALVFAARGLRFLPPSRRYELWLMGPGGDKPAGMLPRPRNGMTGPVLASGLQPGDRLGLTIESASGSAQPTEPVIALVAL